VRECEIYGKVDINLHQGKLEGFQRFTQLSVKLRGKVGSKITIKSIIMHIINTPKKEYIKVKADKRSRVSEMRF
jgi:hypothetical protein